MPYPIAAAINIRSLAAVTLQKELMHTLTLSTAQLQALNDILHYVLCNEETHYDEWCSMGNDQTNHVWLKAAMLDNSLEDAFSVLEQS